LLHKFGGIIELLVTLSKTHIQQVNGDEAIYYVPGYVFARRPRLSGKGCGVGAYISNKINWSRRDDLKDEKIEVMWIEICPNLARGILIAVVYISQTTSKHLHNNFNELCTKLNAFKYF
jgi:hypothetical protein